MTRPPRRAILRDARGAAMLEFALVAAPLIALLIAILATSLVFFAQQGIDTATETAARSLMTGSAQSSALTQAQFKTAACNALPPFLDCGKLMVDVQSASSFSGVSAAAPTLTLDSNGNVTNSFSYSPGGSGAIVIVRLMYIWPVPAGPLGFNLGTMSNGNRLLVGTSVAKTEPYS